MKYLLSILLIVSVALMVTLVYIWPSKPLDKQKIAVTVNGHNVAESQIQNELSKAGNIHVSRTDSLNSIIIKELLIQEAQHQNIDKEESFRSSLKSFYEQSLIKILMDRQYTNLQADVSDQEIDRYLSFFGRIVVFTRMKVNSDPPYAPLPEGGQTTEALFDDLADSLKFTIAFLETGSHSLNFDTSNEQYAIRLDRVAVEGKSRVVTPDRKLIKELLIQNKKEQKISQWLNELRLHASITIHN